jgi:hypothetical protein
MSAQVNSAHGLSKNQWLHVKIGTTDARQTRGWRIAVGRGIRQCYAGRADNAPELAALKRAMLSGGQ